MNAQPLIGAEEERLVPDDRAARGGAELILPQRRDRGLEEIARVQNVVAQEFEHRAVKLVRAGFRHHVEHRAAVASELRAEVAGDEAEFLHRVGIRRGVAGVAEEIVLKPPSIMKVL